MQIVLCRKLKLKDRNKTDENFSGKSKKAKAERSWDELEIFGKTCSSSFVDIVLTRGLEPRPGLEPGTYCLRYSCSTIELSRHFT